MALGADALGIGHQFRDALVAVVHLVVADLEVAEVGERAAVRQVDLLHHAGQPFAVGRQAAVVLDDHVDVVLGAEFAEPAEAVGGQLHLLVVGSPVERALTRIEWQPRNFAASTHL